MKQSEAKERIERLRSEIEDNNYKYYVLSQPAISDFEFDLLLNELETLEKKFPQFIYFRLANPPGWKRYIQRIRTV